MRKPRAWPWLLAAAAILVVWFGMLAPPIYRECRDAGHSPLYCSRLVLR